MKRTRRLSLLAAALVVLASTLALQAVAGPPNHANRLEATFDETTVSVTNRIADLGVFQLINTGTGTVEGLGDATLTLSVTQDRSVQPCGPGSWTNAGIRRIGLDGGVLVLRELVYVCQTDSGPVGTGSWEVDGPSSTGIFADARGSGEDHIDISSPNFHALREPEARWLERFVRIAGSWEPLWTCDGRGEASAAHVQGATACLVPPGA